MNIRINPTININNQSGFGLIEVLVIVVALAAVGGIGYYAWSQTSESDDQEVTTSEEDSAETLQLDNAVRNDMGRIMIELNSYAANNNGQYPADSSDFTSFEEGYISSLDEHPVSGLPYTIDESKANTREYITYANGVCADDGTIQPVDSLWQVALSAELPSGDMHCVDNS